MSKAQETCAHEALQLEPSAHAEEVGYKRPDADQRSAALTKSGRKPPPAYLDDMPLRRKTRLAHSEEQSWNEDQNIPQAFPAPLVLPNDELAWDPKYSPQSFRSWNNIKERNKPNKELTWSHTRRKTLYVAAVPEITPSMVFMEEWLEPRVGKEAISSTPEKLASPPLEDLIKYISAFYHGMPVKYLPGLQFKPWKGPKKPSSNPNIVPKYVGLGEGTSCTRIRARSSPDCVFKGQLNLSDLLDAAIYLLPEDAYSILLLINHDMYEDEADDFCCGRAYGGSRVAVVSTARYHPALDDHAEIDYAHMWPASHCKSYVQNLHAAGLQPERKRARKSKPVGDRSWPMWAAVDAVKTIKKPSTAEDRSGLWFSRVARTAVHELGHCFGMDHCVYYACVMQGTASIAEDVRQPPYLCPVCLKKITYFLAVEFELKGKISEREYVMSRYSELATFCDSWKNVGMFAGYKAWLCARLTKFSKEQEGS
ncbi:hypothetical protein F4819DRAFT_70000 [Hypoxylon fuscum]|nr:hypothetical protein F4819DRAFT_70000 [Hypoxylon fuscum]